MLPRLQAERLLDGYQTTAAGAGRMKKHDLRQWVEKLRRVAQGRQRGRRVRTLDDLRALGVEVEIEPRKEEGKA